MGKMWGWGLGESSDDSDDPVSHIPDADPEDGKFDNEAGIPARLKRLFETWDALKNHDLSALRWDWVGIDQDYGPGKRERRSKPPPPEDPRTQLPDIFGFRGFGMYDCPDFYIRKNHPPCYPLDLVGRLKALHASGVGGRREDGVVYVVKLENRESVPESDDEEDESDDDESDDEQDESDDGNSDDVFIEDVGTYETLEYLEGLSSLYLWEELCQMPK